MGQPQELLEKRFGKLLVIQKTNERTHSGSIKWLCKCDCGNTCIVGGSSLISGHTKSCSCLQKEVTIKRQTKHGCAGSSSTPEYIAWNNIKFRCYNPKSEEYENYGGRGIVMCDRWLHSFENFISDVGLRPTKYHSLDRFPNNETGHYEPGNVRWGTQEQQQRNKRNNHWVEYNGERLIFNDWHKRLDMPKGYIRYHLDKGKSLEWVVQNYKNKRQDAVSH